ncbi:hypothetical protein C8A03DRAFT_43487 [Achaetomium macrosporum]|uniref:Extracellular serine-rich protein n=1 Tax=Achaetomium macrosporum TaxID=79813 RepID=A0AAN7HFW7_9PEZI|nr:hypothetical protein C8A03DRAFT_43487 [Achaetomium macrosporum]
MQLTTLVLATLTSLASAQKTWVVAVAQNGSLTFSPNKLVAQPGEQVQFQFHAGNHTVTQSTFDQPCQPVSMHSNITGFHSGFLPAAASASTGMMPTFTITINDTKPLWLYCAQGKHCENGMVMVINEPTTNASRTLENYKALAAKGTTVVPGAEAGAGGTTGSTDGATTTGDASSATPSTAGAGMLAAPGTIALVAAAGAAFFL